MTESFVFWNWFYTHCFPIKIRLKVFEIANRHRVCDKEQVCVEFILRRHRQRFHPHVVGGTETTGGEPTDNPSLRSLSSYTSHTLFLPLHGPRAWQCRLTQECRVGQTCQSSAMFPQPTASSLPLFFSRLVDFQLGLFPLSRQTLLSTPRSASVGSSSRSQLLCQSACWSFLRLTGILWIEFYWENMPKIATHFFSISVREVWR